MNVPLLAGLGFALFSAWMLVHALRNRRRAAASTDWPSVVGRLTDLRLWGSRKIDGEMQAVENLSVAYAYRVDGTDHRGTTVAFYSLVYPETVDLAERLRVDSAIRVHYNPDDPSVSVLVPGLRAGGKTSSEVLLAVLGLIVASAVMIGGALGILG
ncbi:MAG: DUF3592 domain-containing protein [Acidobacteriota bacterium]